MKKKLFLLVFITAFVVLSASVCFAASDIEVQCADALYDIGLFCGTGINEDGTPIYSLDRVPTRAEAITMLVRLLGKEAEAKAGKWKTPFTDVAAWVEPYVGYAYNHGLANGTSLTTFGGDQTTDAKQYLTFVLRALGYSDAEGDFIWNESYILSNKLGITSGEYDEGGTFKRGNIVTISYQTVKTEMKGSSDSLLTFLNKSGAISNTNLADVILPSYRIDFYSFLADLNSNRLSSVVGNINTEQLNRLATHKSGEVSISQTEIQSLKQTKDLTNVSLDEALEDVELYFKALKYGYGGYYYIGEEKFDAAKAQILSELAELDKEKIISWVRLYRIIANAMAFVQDGHFTFGETGNNQVGETDYKYYYCDFLLYKDNKGYYTISNGDKWYYFGCDNSNVDIAPYLNTDGVISYSPRQFCNEFEAHTQDFLSFSNGTEIKQISISWNKNQTQHFDGIDYNFFMQNDIAYISIRSFENRDDNASNSPILNQFLYSGQSAKNAKLIILDIRGNRGGVESYPITWLNKITGSSPTIERVVAKWENALSGNTSFGNEHYVFSSTKANVVKNNKPIIILVDDNVYSSGESALLYGKAVENCIIIGCNSGGAQTFSGSPSYYLPNSGLTFSFGKGLYFVNSFDNVDLVGYKPDIWCNSGNALLSVINMLENYNIITPTVYSSLISFAETHTNDWNDAYDTDDVLSFLEPKNNYYDVFIPNIMATKKGCPAYDVFLNGITKITDFTIDVTSGKEFGNIIKTADGKITCINPHGNGNINFSITYRGIKFNKICKVFVE